MRIGIFELVNPPPGHAEIIEKAVAACTFPWELLAAKVAKDPDKAILVTWKDTGQGVSGLAYGYFFEIELSDKPYHLGEQQGFVFLHEVGHIVDSALFTDTTRAALTTLMHTPPYVQIGHYNHDHPDAGHASEVWWNGTDAYTSRIYEAWADLFVETFAPTVWDGTAYATDGSLRRWPRFVHWSTDVAAARAIAVPPAKPVPVPVPKVEPAPRWHWPAQAKRPKVSYPPPKAPYIRARWFGDRTNKPIKRIVMHGTVSACRPGVAKAIAQYFARTERKASAHYVVDPAEVYQCVYDSYVAWHDGTNFHSLAVEMCDPVEGPKERWNDEPHRQMLRRAARLVAELCLAYDVPARYIGPVRVRLGRKGITTHNVMRLAFPKSTTHWDPGKWPRRRFMRLVRTEVEAIKKEHR